jgi:hypothetical protein
LEEVACRAGQWFARYLWPQPVSTARPPAACGPRYGTAELTSTVLPSASPRSCCEHPGQALNGATAVGATPFMPDMRRDATPTSAMLARTFGYPTKETWIVILWERCVDVAEDLQSLTRRSSPKCRSTFGQENSTPSPASALGPPLFPHRPWPRRPPAGATPKVMLNVGNPDQAFSLSFLPNDGVGLAREEFVISSAIQVHPMALIRFDALPAGPLKERIAPLTHRYPHRPDYFVERLAEGVGQLAAAFYPKEVIVRLSDFKTNEYAGLLGGEGFEPQEANPMLGFRGASRYYDARYREGFLLECRAMRQVREEMGLTNVKLMIPFCRTVEEGKQVPTVLAEAGLQRGKNELEVYVMCEIPANVILAEAFAEIFDGFSIGPNNLTQLTLGLDRDSEIVAHLFDERNPAVMQLIEQVIRRAHACGCKVGICGQAPSNYPEFARFLVRCGIDSISLNPDTVLKTTQEILEAEQALTAAG